jgi:hypothetical protein
MDCHRQVSNGSSTLVDHPPSTNILTRACQLTAAWKQVCRHVASQFRGLLESVRPKGKSAGNGHGSIGISGVTSRV